MNRSIAKTKWIENTSYSGNHGLLFLNEKTLQDVYVKSGPLAKANEFQVHYWALILRHTGNDGSVLDIAIPTVLFNYKQKVSGADISFDMIDVEEMSQKVKGLHNAYCNKIRTKSRDIVSLINDTHFLSFKVLGSDVNSMHRHPGGRIQRFSGTDLDTRPNNPGIVFPLASGVQKPNFASILAIEDGICYSAHTEYRVVNGKLNEDLKYEKGRCKTIICNPDRRSDIEKIFTEPGETCYYNDDSSIMSVDQDKIDDIQKTIPLPFVVVDASNLSQSSSSRRRVYPFVHEYPTDLKDLEEVWDNPEVDDIWSNRYK